MPKKGTAVFVDYKLGEGQLENPLMWQNFEALPTGDLKELKGWFISSTVTLSGRLLLMMITSMFSIRQTVRKGHASAGWLPPAISVTAGDYLAFDVTVDTIMPAACQCLFQRISMVKMSVPPIGLM